VCVCVCVYVCVCVCVRLRILNACERDMTKEVRETLKAVCCIVCVSGVGSRKERDLIQKGYTPVSSRFS